MTEEKIVVENPDRDLGTEYCEFCEQNYPVKVRVVSSLDAGVHLQISGYHIHMSMNGEPIPLAPRLIRIEDLDDFREIGKLLKSEITRVAHEVAVRDSAQTLQDAEEEVCAICGSSAEPEAA
jgi:hypothetical protein